MTGPETGSPPSGPKADVALRLLDVQMAKIIRRKASPRPDSGGRGLQTTPKEVDQMITHESTAPERAVDCLTRVNRLAETMSSHVLLGAAGLLLVVASLAVAYPGTAAGWRGAAVTVLVTGAAVAVLGAAAVVFRRRASRPVSARTDLRRPVPGPLPWSLADALVTGVEGPVSVAVELLLRAGVIELFDRADVGRYVVVYPLAEPVRASVQWLRLATEVDAGTVQVAPAQRAVILAAASIAYGYPVKLRAVLADLDPAGREALVWAMRAMVVRPASGCARSVPVDAPAGWGS